MKNDWNATHYDSKLGFVSEFGKGVVSLLQPKPGENILDLGCGSGDLSFEISKYGACVVGIDLSESMIQQAQKKYPDLQFEEVGIASRDRNPWYFPSIGEYTTLLEEHGFRTVYAAHFDRPTQMIDGDNGLEHWLNGFAENYLHGLDTSTRKGVIERVAELTRSKLYKDGQWVVDYKRLQIVAIKK